MSEGTELVHSNLKARYEIGDPKVLHAVLRWSQITLDFKGKRYDIGNKLGFLKTNIVYALQDPEIGGPLKTWLKEFVQGLD